MASAGTVKIGLTGLDAFQDVVQRLERAERELASLREYLDQHNDRLCLHDVRVTGVEGTAEQVAERVVNALVESSALARH